MSYDFAIVHVTHEDDMDGIEPWLIIREGLSDSAFRAVVGYAVTMGTEVTHPVSAEEMERIAKSARDMDDYCALDHGAMIDFSWDCDFGMADTIL